MDEEPRAWSYEEVQTLKDLAECAMREIDLSTRLREAQTALLHRDPHEPVPHEV